MGLWQQIEVRHAGTPSEVHIVHGLKPWLFIHVHVPLWRWTRCAHQEKPHHYCTRMFWHDGEHNLSGRTLFGFRRWR